MSAIKQKISEGKFITVPDERLQNSEKIMILSCQLKKSPVVMYSAKLAKLSWLMTAKIQVRLLHSDTLIVDALVQQKALPIIPSHLFRTIYLQQPSQYRILLNQT